MLGDRSATLDEVRPFDLHGVNYSDVALTFDDGTRTSARLGPEAVPETLQAGDRVVVTMAAGLVLSLRKP
jgi:hypothetical protein